MTRAIRTLSFVGALLCSVVPAEAAPTDDAKASQPNVLFIAIDDLNGWIGALDGHPQVQTPNIDRLAKQGVLFSNAHCAAPACNPSRTSVMTGIRPSTSGVYLNGQDWRKSEVLKAAVTLPMHFRNHGYEVLGGGKLYHAASLSEAGHEGYLDPDPWDEYFPSKSRQLPVQIKPEPFPANGSTKFYKGYFDWAALDVEDAEMGDAQVVSWAEQHLAKKHAKPLFLGVGIYRPHIPWHTPRRYFDLYPLDEIVMPEVLADDLADVPQAGQAMARRDWQQWMVEEDEWRKAVQGYLASVTFADAMVGRLIDALASGPLNENTVIVLWSDHGYHLGHKEHWEKFALWDQATRVPMIVVEPNAMGAGKVCDEPTSLLDIYPTLVDLCGLKSLPQLDGQSLVPLLRDPTASTERVALTTQGLGNHAIRSNHWRYIRYADGTEELYDHRRDPNEFENLAGKPEHAAVKTRLAARLPATDAPMNPMPKAKAGQRFKK